MASIEQRIETPGKVLTPDYARKKFTPEQIAAGEHRKFVGGKWDTHGRFQLDFLISQGLRPEHRFLDVGCGSLRAGRHLVDYLDPGNYFGIDANLDLLQVGYESELSDEQRERLPVDNLRATDRFAADFGQKFDMAIAQSVFTHISLNAIRLCMFRISPQMVDGGKFFATFFEESDDKPIDYISDEPDRRPRFNEKNLFWYHQRDLRWCSTYGDWRFEYYGDWDHPVGQMMVEFVKLPRSFRLLRNRFVPMRFVRRLTGDQHSIESQTD